MGGKSSSSSSTANQQSTTNIDRRTVIQDGAYVGDGSTANVVFNSTDGEVMQTLAAEQGDAVKAIAQMGATVVRDMGGAVVDLAKDSQAANSKAWDSTLDFGAATVDRIIDSMSESYGMAAKNIEAGYALAGKAVDSFTPTENKNADVAKYAVLAVGVVAAVIFLNKQG